MGTCIYVRAGRSDKDQAEVVELSSKVWIDPPQAGRALGGIAHGGVGIWFDDSDLCSPGDVTELQSRLRRLADYIATPEFEAARAAGEVVRLGPHVRRPSPPEE